MKKIPLVNSKEEALVDDEDYDWLIQYKWYYINGFAIRLGVSGEMIEMGRDILNHSNN